MRVAILHNAVPDDAPLEDQDTLIQVDAVRAALARLGHEPATVSCTLNLAALHDELRRLRPDVVFNLVESLAEADSLVYLPLAVLDVLGLPYTGSRTESLFLTTHKLLAKERLRQAGLPTPAWMESRSKNHEVHEGARRIRNAVALICRAPSCSSWIIKGVWDQGSRGMDDDAVLTDVDLAEVRKRLAERAARSAGPCFAEQFVEGREFNLSVLAGPAGPEVLPPAEIDFSAFPPAKPRIVGHRAKWQADSFEAHTRPAGSTSRPSDRPLLDELRHLAEQCWTLFGLRGWVRVDFRVDAAGGPWILEINANPCLTPDAGFAAALERASIPFDRAIQRILDDCLVDPLSLRERARAEGDRPTSPHPLPVSQRERARSSEPQRLRHEVFHAIEPTAPLGRLLLGRTRPARPTPPRRPRRPATARSPPRTAANNRPAAERNRRPDRSEASRRPA